MSPVAITVSEGQKRLEAITPLLEASRQFEHKQIPVRSHWASKMGHPCNRYLYYMRTAWEHATPKDWKGIGERGNVMADWWKQRMISKGFKVIHDQMPLSESLSRQYGISGRIDGRISVNDIRPVLYEFKTISQNYYNKMNSYQDFVDSKIAYYKAYPAQIQIYLLDQNEESGLFILCNVSTWEWKIIPVYLDYVYAEWLLKRAEDINKALTTKTIPERIPYGRTCEQCEFATICLPDIRNEGLEFIDQDELLALVQERESLKQSHKRYEEVDEQAKEFVKIVGKDFILSNEYKVCLKKISSTRIDIKSIPIDIRSQYEVKNEITKVDFVPLGQK